MKVITAFSSFEGVYIQGLYKGKRKNKEITIDLNYNSDILTIRQCDYVEIDLDLVIPTIFGI